MYYAIVGPGISGVYDNWKRVEELSTLFPYCRYRKFKTEAECWEFVYAHESSRNSLNLYKYGNTFENVFVRMRYIVRPDMMYFTYDTTHIGKIRLDDIPGATIQYTSRCILVKMKPDMPLDNDTILSHLQVIDRGIEIIGGLIDIDIVVPDHSIYYALTAYSGDDFQIKAIKDNIHNRLGGVSFSLYVKEGDDWVR